AHTWPAWKSSLPCRRPTQTERSAIVRIASEYAECIIEPRNRCIRDLQLYSAPVFICHSHMGGREMRVKFHRRSLIVGLVSVAFAGAASIASATHSWNGYHWARTANPFTVKLGNNVSSAWTSSLNT